MLRSETADAPDRYKSALAGLAAYQSAPRDARPAPLPVRASAGRATLRAPTADRIVGAPPVVLVPSLINPAAILDLDERTSLLRWLATQGFDAMLVDWGTPTPADADQDIGHHVATLLVPLIETLDEPPVLVGYCLGGTMAHGAASLTPVRALATIAAPWRFAGYGEARETMTALWSSAKPGCETLGLVPMEVLQSGFWRLDPGRTVAKYEAFGSMATDSTDARAFIRLEDWANAGAPLTYAAGRQLFEDFVGTDTPGTAAWVIDGRAIDPSARPLPRIEFVSLADRIVPAATAARIGERRELAIGHVGMIVGRRARADLWQPLADWINALPPIT